MGVLSFSTLNVLMSCVKVYEKKNAMSRTTHKALFSCFVFYTLWTSMNFRSILIMNTPLSGQKRSHNQI